MTTSDGTHPATLGRSPTVTAAEARAVAASLPEHGLTERAVVEVAAERVHMLLLAGLLEELAGKPPAEATVTVMAGTGHKGAVALALARRMAEADLTVNVVLARQPKEYDETVQGDIEALDKAAKKVYKGYNERAFDQADLAVDGLIGVGLDGKPKAALSLLIKGANFSMKPIVALDVPTGLDASTGAPAAMTVKAKVTVALGVPKAGLAAPGAAGYAGRVFVVDVGVPDAVWSAAAGRDIVVDRGADGWRELPRDA